MTWPNQNFQISGRLSITWTVWLLFLNWACMKLMVLRWSDSGLTYQTDISALLSTISFWTYSSVMWCTTGLHTRQFLFIIIINDFPNSSQHFQFTLFTDDCTLTCRCIYGYYNKHRRKRTAKCFKLGQL